MRFVFWQNIISIHQKAFLEALAKQPGVAKVLLVVEHELTPVRKSMGWEAPELQGVKVLLSPSDKQITDTIADNRDAVHIMGGIRIGHMITKAFDAAVSAGCRIGIMTEPYNDAGIKGALRGLKYRYYGTRYFKSIDFVLAIGRQGVAQYTALGYPSHRLFPWAYFITLSQPALPASDGVRIIYAGRLEEAKGIARFTQQMIGSGIMDFKLDIYGTGPDEETMKKSVTAAGLADKITFTRFLRYDELLARYKEYNWVVLPSTGKDGWGVVISEGLLNGLKVICSLKCGVSGVVKDGWNGVTFDWNDEGSCRRAIGKMFAGQGFAEGVEIKAWAESAIGGEAGARYFIGIMDSVYGNAEKPSEPWSLQ